MSRFGVKLAVFSLFIGCAPAPEAPHTAHVERTQNKAESERMSEGVHHEPNEELNDGPNENQADIEWANQFFMTQVYDVRWNPDGIEDDTKSNNCGPASLAMVMTARGSLPTTLESELAIDHARATMYPSYPEIPLDELLEDAELYTEQNRICIDDDTHPVYFDHVQGAPSIAQGIEHGGGGATFGYSLREINELLETDGAVIAHGHITTAWIRLFDGAYGAVGEEPIPHFIALFPASTAGHVIVSDPMHRGGAVVMNSTALKAFFKSPVNVYDTTIRVVSWSDCDHHSATQETPEPFEVGSDEWRSFAPITIDDAHTLTLTMTGFGDADLYARRGAMPTEDEWDCRPYSSTSDEQCRLKGEGSWFYRVRGYASPASVVTLTAAMQRTR